MKKVLIIAYLFPPIGGGGVQRAVKMAKYLGQFNVDVSILTVESPNHVSLDHSLLEQLPPDVKIYREKEWLQSRYKTAANSGAQNNTEQQAQTKSFKQKIISLVKPPLKAIKDLILIPDDQILWYRNAVKKGVQIVQDEKIDVIFSTSGPYTNHLVGKAINKKTNVKWIADFRDPWTQNMHRPKQQWRLNIEEKLERSVIANCDILMTVTNSFARNFKEKYGDEIKRLEVIHNGFDPDDYNNLVPTKRCPNKWTFVYTGIFYDKRNPRLFLTAVSELIAEGKIDKSKLSIEFAGVFDYPGYTENYNCVKENNLQDVVHLWGSLPHKQALETLAGADQLLLIGDISDDSSSYIPGKLFEYMAVKKPIFALSIEGESTNIIKSQKLGIVVEPNNKDMIKKELLKCYDHWVNKNTRVINLTNTKLYERDEQAKMLANIINRI